MSTQEQLEALQAIGFDGSYITESKDIRIRCSQCDALVIQGIPCHEVGCPNVVKDDDEDGNEFYEDEFPI